MLHQPQHSTGHENGARGDCPDTGMQRSVRGSLFKGHHEHRPHDTPTVASVNQNGSTGWAIVKTAIPWLGFSRPPGTPFFSVGFRWFFYAFLSRRSVSDCTSPPSPLVILKSGEPSVDGATPHHHYTASVAVLRQKPNCFAKILASIRRRTEVGQVVKHTHAGTPLYQKL